MVDKQPVHHSAPPGLAGYSLVGVDPKLPPAKRQRVGMEPPEVHGDDEIADANPHVDADHGEDGVAPKGPRAIPAQYTPAELKTYMPFRCQHKGVNITLDDLSFPLHRHI